MTTNSNAIKLINLGEIYPGDLFMVVDRERKRYTLKFEMYTDKYVTFKQMGRNTVRQIQVDTNMAAIWVHNQYTRIEPVFKEKVY
jgi:hypothetical protein